MRSLRVLVLVATAACGGFIDQQAADTTYRILERSQAAARRQADLELARAAMPSGILQLEAFALAYPDHRGFKLLHAEAVCQYVAAFAFDDWEDAQLRGRTEEATRLATRVRGLVAACADAQLALLPAPWRAARTTGDAAWSAMLARATRAHVPHLLWLAWGDAMLLAIEPLRHVARLGSITATLERCIALAPGFHDSDAELVLGTLAAGRSRIFGGADGSAQFARARTRLGEGALIVDVLFARGTLVAKQDRARFVAALERVLAADVTRWPERRLANELARRKAERYLGSIDSLLPPSASPD